MTEDLPDPPHVSWGQSRYLVVAGERMRVVERGAVGPRLLLVHGYASNAQTWRGVINRLDGRFRMAAIDLVGFGWSSRRHSLRLTGDAYAERLADVLDALEWPTAHVAGQSWGGGLSQRLAAAHPDRVDRMVLIATVDPSATLRLGTAGLRLGMRFPRLARLAVTRAQRTAAEAAGTSSAELARGYVEPLLIPGSATFLDHFVAEHAVSTYLDLARVSVPTLVIGPLEDRVVHPATTRSVADRIPGATYEGIPGASHSVASEAPDLIAGLMADFLLREGRPPPRADRGPSWGSAVEKDRSPRKSRG